MKPEEGEGNEMEMIGRCLEALAELEIDIEDLTEDELKALCEENKPEKEAKNGGDQDGPAFIQRAEGPENSDD